MEKSDYKIINKLEPHELPKKEKLNQLEEVKYKFFSEYKKNVQQYLKENKKEQGEEDTNIEIKPISIDQIRKEQNERMKNFTKNSFTHYTYQVLDSNVTKSVCDPEIDTYTINTVENAGVIRPGQFITFFGTCFGTTQGKVLLEIKDKEYIELRIINWYNFQVEAFLSNTLTGFRPFDGKIWIIQGEQHGKTSNAIDLHFDPLKTVHMYRKRLKCGPNAFGAHRDKIFLNNQTIPDTDFSVNAVGHSHEGDGHAELHPPNASDLRLGQGFHMGVASCGTCYLILEYIISGPKGIDPPPINGITYKGIVSEETVFVVWPNQW